MNDMFSTIIATSTLSFTPCSYSLTCHVILMLFESKMIHRVQTDECRDQNWSLYRPWRFVCCSPRLYTSTHTSNVYLFFCNLNIFVNFSFAILLNRVVFKELFHFLKIYLIRQHMMVSGGHVSRYVLAHGLILSVLLFQRQYRAHLLGFWRRCCPQMIAGIALSLYFLYKRRFGG